MAMLHVIIGVLAILLTTACSETQTDPVSATVQARQTEAMVSTQVEGTLAAQEEPFRAAFEADTLTLLFEVELAGITAESGNISGSILGGEARFRAREPNQEPDMYFTFRSPNFDEDSSLLVLDGKVYTKNSRFGNEWLREVLYSDIYEYFGISFANNIFVYADTVFGFDVSSDMAGWENLGVETLDGRQLVHFQRPASVNQQLHDLILRRVMFDLWINERNQLVHHFRAFIETNRMDITLTADIIGYNEPVEFPNPLG